MRFTGSMQILIAWGLLGCYSENMVVRATCVCIHKGKLLLLKQSFPDMPTFWSLPGGKVEEGETIDHALIREVQEETGLVVQPKRLLFVSQRFLREKHVVQVIIDADYVSGEIGDGTQHTATEIVHEMAFVDVQKLENFGISEKFADLVRKGFPKSGEYVSSMDEIGL